MSELPWSDILNSCTLSMRKLADSGILFGQLNPCLPPPQRLPLTGVPAEVVA